MDLLIGPKNLSKTLSLDKNRYEMTLRASIHRFLSIGWALGRPHFLPLTWFFLIVRVKSWFCIGKYGTNSTFTIHGCIHVIPWFLSCLQVPEMDFISIFFDWSGPRLVLIFTIHRKTRYEMRVTVPKYQFFSIGEALRKSHFLSLSLHLELL